MRRRLARGFFVLLCGVVATVLGVVAAILWTPPGLRLVARLVNEQAQALVRGSIHVGAVQGRWLRGFSLDDVVIKDTSGVVLATIPHLSVRYTLRNFLSGQVVLDGAELSHPDIQIIKHRNGRLNYQEIFRLNEGPRGGGRPSPLIELRNLTIDSGRVVLRLPWNPDGRLKTARQVDSALAFERGKPGRRIEPGPEGLEMVRVLSDVQGTFALIRLSSPDRAPTTLEIERLATRISDPGIDLRDLRGSIRTKDDSLLFDLEKVELPGTTGSGSGRIDWPSDTLLYRFGFNAPRLALADLRWVSPDFPDFTGAARLTAKSLSGSRIEYDIRELAVAGGQGRVAGRLVAITDIYRGLGFRGLNLDLGNLDLEVVRPYLDTLPLRGRLDGRLEANGFFDGMTVALDWRFADAVVPGAESHINLAGNVQLGGALGMTFGGATLRDTDLDLRTVREVAPSVILEGRLGLDGTLNGPWKNVVFHGDAVHRDLDRPASRLRGTVRLDTRALVFAVEADVVLDSLSFRGIGRAFPGLTARGALGGRVKLAGNLEHLEVDADVGGEIGHLVMRGGTTLMPPRYGADSLRVQFDSLDLAALSDSGIPTRLNGTALVTGTITRPGAPTGRLGLTLGAGRIREVRFDSALAELAVQDSVITVDTVAMHWTDIRLGGAGTLGWAPPKTGRITLHADAKDLAPFDSLALALTGFTHDTLREDRVLSGRVLADATLSGALGSLDLSAAATADSLKWLTYTARDAKAELGFSFGQDTLSAHFTVDSLRAGNRFLSAVEGSVSGRPDSLRLDGRLEGKHAMRLGGGGRLQRLAQGRLFHADSLRLQVGHRDWRLASPLDARVSDAGIVLDSVRFATADGSGSVDLAGSIPGDAPAELSITALGIALQDIYVLLQQDTAGVQGTLALDARLAGTADAPELRGSSTITGPVFGDFQAPLMRGVFDYRQRQLRSNITFWRAGEPVVEVDATLPYDMSFRRVAKRQLPGPLTIVAKGDSVNLAIAEAFTPNLRRMGGVVDIDTRIEGSWDAPRLAGQVEFRDGVTQVPSLGVQYGPINGLFRLAGDSIFADSIRVAGESGEMIVTGNIRLERLTQPVLGLDFAATDFRLINVPNYMKVRASGDVRITGGFAHPTLSGVGRLSNSVIYFSDLVTKEIINLEDPLNAELVDTLALRQQDLRASFQSRFLDSLTIRDLDFIVDDDVWLRSLEANFQLEGRIRVNKVRALYRIDGTLNTPRGTYTLDVPWLVNRTFTVERGTVRYFGDLDAQLDVEAQHLVKSPQGETGDIPVIAHITGTLELPKLTLRTPPDRPPMTEQQIYSLLVLGTTDARAEALFSDPQQRIVAYTSNVLSSQLQRALLGTGQGTLQIRPGLTSGGLIGSNSSATQVAIGHPLSERIFVTANAGFCFSAGQSTFGARNLGASVEYRFNRFLRAVVSAEPLQTCFAPGLVSDALATTRRYQFGAELRWDRDY